MITAINKYNADGDNMFSKFIDGFDGEVYELQNKLAELYDEEYKLALSGKLEGTEGAQVTLDIQEAEAQLDTLRQEAAQDFHTYIEVDSDIERTEDTIAQLKKKTLRVWKKTIQKLLSQQIGLPKQRPNCGG